MAKKSQSPFFAPTSTVLIICILHHAFSAHLFYCTLVQMPVFTLHYAAPFIAVADHRDQDPPVAYYPLKDVATYLSRSRSRPVGWYQKLVAETGQCVMGFSRARVQDYR